MENLSNLSDVDDDEISKLLKDSKRIKEKWSIAEGEPQAVFLAKVDGEEIPILIHSFLSVRGNRKEYGPNQEKSVVLTGLGRKAKAAMVDKEKLFSGVNLPYFSFSTLLQANCVEDIEKMQPKEGNATRGAKPVSTLGSCIYVPKHLALLILSVDASSVEELVLLIKTNIITRVKTLAECGEEDINSVTFEEKDGNETKVLNFSHDQVWRHGGAILQWLMHFRQNKLSPVKLHIPLSGHLIQDAARERELSRLGRNLPQAVSTGTNESNATITEHFEKLRDIMELVSSKHSEKTENSKVKDVLFLSQLQAAASEDGIVAGEVTETAETILKTKDLEGRKTLFLRALAGLGSDDVILSAGQTKDLVTGSWTLCERVLFDIGIV